MTARLKQYHGRIVDPSLRENLIRTLAYILTIIGKAEKCMQRRRIGQLAKSILKNDEITGAVEKLHRYVEAELGLVIAITFKSVQ